MSALRNAWIHYPHSDVELNYFEGISFQRKTSDHYGVLCLQTENVPITQEPILFHFQVDVSGSMSDTTSDGRTKMQLIIHTLTNMLHYFAEKCENGYIQVTGFDDKIHPYIAPIHVTSENVVELVAILSKMRPMELTDIGMAIQQLCKDVDTDIVNIPRHRRVGILLTDGEPTVGIQSSKELAALVPEDISISFIALGDEHSGEVMHALGHVSPYTSNWFVDKLEHTGNVYGEIIFNELYRVSEQTQLRVKNGTIYDYVSGEFVETLNVGMLSSETCKYYHILTNNPDSCEVEISGVLTNGDKYCFTASDMPPLILKEENIEDFPTNEALFIEKQWLRLYVQTLMSRARNIPIPSQPQLRRRVVGIQHNFTFAREPFEEPAPINASGSIDFRKEIAQMTCYVAEFITMHQLEEDSLMNGVRDDLMVLERTFGTNQFIKYAGIREDSQGRQYTCNTITELPDNCCDTGHISKPALIRSATSAYASPGRIDLMTSLSQDEDDTNTSSTSSILEVLEQYNH